MIKLQNTDENCRDHIERLLSHAGIVPEGSFNRLLAKTLLGFSIEEGWIDFQFVAKDVHVNLMGVVHGGVMAGLADECMGYGAASLIGIDGEVLTTSDMQFNCMKPIYSGDVLRVHISVKHVGKRSVIATAEIFRGEELVKRRAAFLELLHSLVYSIQFDFVHSVLL